MEPSPLVSVIIPAFNASHWIGDTLESVVRQSYTNIEVIVVDDGSSDETASIAKQYSARNVRVIEQTNSGACAARNEGLRESRGEFIQFLDADDLLSPDKIEQQIRLLSCAPDGCVAVCGVVYFQDGGDPSDGLESPGYPELNSDNPVDWLIELWTPGPGYGTTRWGMVPYHAWLVPRHVVIKAGQWDTQITQDQDGEYFARVLTSSKGVRWEPSGRVYYRKFRANTSVSSGRSVRHIRGRLDALDSKVRHIMPLTTDWNREKANAAFARQYLNVAYHSYPSHPDIVKEAEEKVAALGGYDTLFFGKTRLKHVERLAGWKFARRISVAYHRIATAVVRLGS